VEGVSGTALKFDGDDDKVSIPNSNDFDLITNSITIEAWFKFDINPYSIDDGGMFIVDKYGSWRLYYSAEDLDKTGGETYAQGDQFFLDLWDFDGVNTNRNNWEANRWYYIAALYDGTSAMIFINGELDNSVQLQKDLSTSTNALSIGSESNSQSRGFNGIMDEVSIYNYNLSSDHIMERYLDLKPEENENPPILDFMSANNMIISEGSTLQLSASATDLDDDILSYHWTCVEMPMWSETGDTIEVEGLVEGFYHFFVNITDGYHFITGSIEITVIGDNQAPVITSVTIIPVFKDLVDLLYWEPGKIDEGIDIELSCIASDPDGDTLTYTWTNNQDLSWTMMGASVVVNAEDLQAGRSYFFTCRVSDGFHEVTQNSDEIEIISMEEPEPDPDGDTVLLLMGIITGICILIPVILIVIIIVVVFLLVRRSKRKKSQKEIDRELDQLSSSNQGGIEMKSPDIVAGDLDMTQMPHSPQMNGLTPPASIPEMPPPQINEMLPPPTMSGTAPSPPTNEMPSPTTVSDASPPPTISDMPSPPILNESSPPPTVGQAPTPPTMTGFSTPPTTNGNLPPSPMSGMAPPPIDNTGMQSFQRAPIPESDVKNEPTIDSPVVQNEIYMQPPPVKKEENQY